MSNFGRIHRYTTNQKRKISLFKKLWADCFKFTADIDENVKQVIPGYKFIMRRMRNRRASKKSLQEQRSEIQDFDLDSCDFSDDLSSDDSDFDYEENEFPKINDHFAGISFSGWDKAEFSINLSKSNSKVDNSIPPSCVSPDQASGLLTEKKKDIILINDGFSDTEDCSDGNSLQRKKSLIKK